MKETAHKLKSLTAFDISGDYLISQFEHGIGSGIAILINITDIYKFRDQDESDRAKSHKYCEKIRQPDRCKQMIK